MSVTQARRRWGEHLSRTLGLDANPLRRSLDRVESWLRIGLLVVFLASAPVACLGVGHAAYAGAVSAARHQAATEHQARAVLTENAPRTVGYPTRAQGRDAWVRARWTAPNGSARSGVVQAPLGAHAGAAVTVWTDASGHLATPPPQHADIVSRVIGIVTLLPIALALLLMGVGWLAHHLLDRRRMGAWERAWAAVEPQWTRRLR